MNDPKRLAPPLQMFRQVLHGCLERRAVALMNLTDVLLTAGPALAAADLSLEAVYHHGWGSVYATRAKGCINNTALRGPLPQYPLTDCHPVYTLDCRV